MRHPRSALAAAALMLAAGCGESAPPAGPANLPPPTFGPATITGRVTYTGTPPERPMLAGSDLCHAGARGVQDESVVIAEGNGLADVVVSLEGVPASDGYGQPQVTLDQRGCRFDPHVIAVQVNQPANITTSDPVFHNVHWTSDANGDVNFGLPNAGDARLHRFVAADRLRVRCDVHPWMSAHVAVLPHPFFGVSDRAAGRFEIGRVPPGRYTAVAWHPLLGERRGEVEVGDGVTATLDFTFELSR